MGCGPVGGSGFGARVQGLRVVCFCIAVPQIKKQKYTEREAVEGFSVDVGVPVCLERLAAWQ